MAKTADALTIAVHVPCESEDGLVLGDTWVDLSTQCFACRHWNRHSVRPFTCSAFPMGIPKEIVQAAVSHDTPYDGDGGIRFVQLEM